MRRFFQSFKATVPWLLPALLWLPPALPAAAQTADFSTLTVSVGASARINGNALDRGWHRPAGFAAGVATPFLGGSAGVAARLWRYRSRGASTPAYDAVTALMQYDRPIVGGGPLTVYAGMQAGICRMHFEGEVHEQARREDEVTLGAVAGLRAAAGPWSLDLAAGLDRVYFATPVDEVTLGLALRRTLTAPRWLRTLLR